METTTTYQPGDRVHLAGDDVTFTVRTVHPETDESVGGIDLGYGGTVVRFMVDPADLTPA